jgi:hypothetical protein
MLVIAFITHAPTVRDFLARLPANDISPNRACPRPPACPSAATPASAPARKAEALHSRSGRASRSLEISNGHGPPPTVGNSYMVLSSTVRRYS